MLELKAIKDMARRRATNKRPEYSGLIKAKHMRVNIQTVIFKVFAVKTTWRSYNRHQ